MQREIKPRRYSQDCFPEEFELLSRLVSLTTAELQNCLSLRLGRYSWTRRFYDEDLRMLSRALLRQGTLDEGAMAPECRAFLSVLGTLVEALRNGEDEVIPGCQPWQIVQAVRAVWRVPREEHLIVDTLLVRSIVEPLLAGDRPSFRALLATLGRELVTLASMGTDGRLSGVTSSFGYMQLRVLQDALNGVLQASRVEMRVSNRNAAAV